MRRSALLMAAIVLPASASAEATGCDTRAEVLSHLAKTFKEAPVAIGLANNGGLIEVLASGTGSTWTIILTMPDGISCLLAAGEDWQTRIVTIDDPAI